jgi:uncharacterized protein YjbJ (UPF0337 family)
MTDDRIRGAARQGLGHLEDAAGGLVGDDRAQMKGKLNEAAGAVQNAYGKAADAVMDASDQVQAFARQRPLAAVGAGIGVGLILGFALAQAGRD